MEWMSEWISMFLPLGWIGAVGIIFLEAFVPMLPLVALVMLVVALYGAAGFFYVWLGMASGSFCLFLLLRFLSKHLSFDRRFGYHGSLGLLVVLSFVPFLPTFLITALFALSSVSWQCFLLLSICARGFVGFLFATFGVSFLQMQNHPFLFLIALLLIAAFAGFAHVLKRRFLD